MTFALEKTVFTPDEYRDLRRMYAALKGNGATVRWVELPLEEHGYRARESIGHALWEMIRWADTYVKKPGSAPDSP